MTDAAGFTLRESAALEHSAACLRALGHADRLRIVAALSGAAMTVGELCSALGLPQSRTSQHLAQLRGVGLVTCARLGKCREYRLTAQGSADLPPIDAGAIVDQTQRRGTGGRDDAANGLLVAGDAAAAHSAAPDPGKPVQARSTGPGAVGPQTGGSQGSGSPGAASIVRLTTGRPRRLLPTAAEPPARMIVVSAALPAG